MEKLQLPVILFLLKCSSSLQERKYAEPLPHFLPTSILRKMTMRKFKFIFLYYSDLHLEDDYGRKHLITSPSTQERNLIQF